jgi:hypothetical protein
MSVLPWMLQRPRRARMPPPGLPTLPNRPWMIAAARIICAPVVWWVQPTA